MSIGKGIMKIYSKFAGEHPCQSVISIKFHCNFIEITLRHGCSPVNLLYIFRTLFPENTVGVYFWMKKGAFEIIATMAFWQVMHLTTWCALGGHIVCDFMYKLRSSGFCMIWAFSTSWAEIARKFGNSTSMLSYYWKEINQSATENRTIIC